MLYNKLVLLYLFKLFILEYLSTIVSCNVLNTARACLPCVSKRFVACLASFLGVSFYLQTTDPQ